MNRTVLQTQEFCDALSLSVKLGELLDSARLLGYPDDTVYIECDGFYMNGVAKLVEQTLTDGSKVANIELWESE